MPLARIITDSVDDSLELSIQLRARGFQVETVAPGEVPNTLADLEVRLEECSPEDVMTRAAESSQELDDLWVFVAPGALDDRVRPIREISTTLPAAWKSETAPAKTKAPYAKPIVHSSVPEDDPLICELASQAGPPVPAPIVTQGAVEPIRTEAVKHASTPKIVMASPIAREVERELPEVIVFPKSETPKQNPIVHGPQNAEHNPAPRHEPQRPADMQFWRIASVVALLAIAALILGANLSRPPEPVTSQAVTAPVVPVSVQHPRASKIPASRQADARLNAAPRVVTAAALPAAPPKPDAAKTTPQKPAHHRSSVHQGDYIAQDTVVYYDGRGGSAPRKSQSSANAKP